MARPKSKTPLAASPDAHAQPDSQPDTTPDTPSNTLPDDCSISQAVSMKKLLSDWLHQSGDITLLGHAVQRFSTPAAQLLLTFQQALINEGRKLTIEDASQTMQDALDDLGLRTSLNLKH